ncbi:MAG: hypothetical protein IPN32_39155 [Deltaproteobacteria bacterium]|nr:hypothetical protein [Deltaproteobacteria bacterium]
MPDYYDPPDDYAGPRVTVSLTRKPRPCRRCDASGVVSDRDGRGVYCPECNGTTVANPPRERMRMNWGRTK